jgi:bifunctional non-homologous end joining protein LigD
MCFRFIWLTGPDSSRRPAGGLDLRPLPLEERKGRLQHLLSRFTGPGIQLNEHLQGDGATIFEHACKLGFEGISKHREHP